MTDTAAAATVLGSSSLSSLGLPLDSTVSAAEANRSFSRLLRGVREGRRYVVTSHGRPIAQLTPPGATRDVATAARAALLQRLAQEPAVRVDRWTRDELYEDER